MARSRRTVRRNGGAPFAWLVLGLLGLAHAACASETEPVPNRRHGARPAAPAADIVPSDTDDDEPDAGAEECEPSEMRECHVMLGRHGNVVSCFVGVSVCEGGMFGPCSEGGVVDVPDPKAAPAAGDGETAVLLSFSDAAPCDDNPCDPACQKFVEKPDGGVTLAPGAPKYDWETGSFSGLPKGLASKGLKEPCYHAEDCQMNNRCESPGLGTCGHDICAVGVALETCCNPCVEQVCAVEPTCCFQPYGGWCAHDPCATGTSLKSSCDPCVASICAVDPYCCSSQWDSICVAEVGSVCNKSCQVPGGWTEECVEKVRTVCGAHCKDGGACLHDACYTGASLDASCDPCVASICAVDPYCCATYGSWDALCVSEVGSVCGEICGEKGQCVPWLPGEVDETCDKADLALGIPCEGQLVVCNHGTQPAPPGVAIVHFPANSQQYPKCNPNLGHPGAVTCTTSEPVPPGECINVACAGLNGNREIMVNPSGAAHVPECSCEDNWSFYSNGLTCGPPECPGTESHLELKKSNLFLALSRSGSMAYNGWTESMSAFKAFLQDPKSAGLGIALRFWPDAVPVPGCDSGCSATACATPLVPLGTLTAPYAPADVHEHALINAIDSRTPGGVRPILPALDGALAWAIAHVEAHPLERADVVLFLDGPPNHCDTSFTSLEAIAKAAFLSHGVRTFVIGVDAACSMPELEGLAAAGGTEHAFYACGNSGPNSKILAALEAIRGAAAGCSFDLPDVGQFDPGNLDVVFSPSNGAPTTLSQVWYANECGTGWYFDDYANATKLSLCPTTCAALQADQGARLTIRAGCPSLYEPTTVKEVYEATCPEGSVVQWAHFSYDTSTPGDSRITFAARTDETAGFVEAGSAMTLATASQQGGSQVCPMSGPAPCPIDLYTALGGEPAANHVFLELSITLAPSSDETLAPVLKSWNLTYSCPAAE